MFRCSCFFVLFFILLKKNLPFSSVGEPLHDHGHIYLHDLLPFNGPFFMTPPFPESQKVVTLTLFSPPSPLLIPDKSLMSHKAVEAVEAA